MVARTRRPHLTHTRSLAAGTTGSRDMSSAGPAVRARCADNSLPCRNSTSCYRRLWACDGIRDCPLADDELGCYHSANKTLEKGSSGGVEQSPYNLELGFLIFVMAGGLLFLLFLWWLCNISVHRRGHRGVSCMEALVADLKDRTWKSDLYDLDEFSDDPHVNRSLQREAAMEEGRHRHHHHHHQTGSLLHSPRHSSRLANSSRCSDLLQDVDEMEMLGSPQHRPPCRPHALNISRPPSYNSCLNASGNTAGPVIINPVRRSSHLISDDLVDVISDDEKPRERESSVAEEDGSGDLLPSYDEVTREGAGLGGDHRERLPKYPPAYQEVVESE